MAASKHIGSSLENFLREEGLLEEVDARVQKRIVADQLRAAMRARKLSEAALARRMATSRTVVRALLDPHNPGATIGTLARAARAVGYVLSIRFDAPTARPRKRRRPAARAG